MTSKLIETALRLAIQQYHDQKRGKARPELQAGIDRIKSAMTNEERWEYERRVA